MEHLIFLASGILIGGLIIWLFLKNRTSDEANRLKGERETEITRLQEKLLARDDDVSRLSKENEKLSTDLREKSESEAYAKASLEAEKKATKEKLELLNEAKVNLEAAFKALSSDALRNNNSSFLELANATLEKFQQSAKGDLEKRQTAIDELVKPVKESLEKFNTKVGDLEKSRVGAYQELQAQVKNLLDTQLLLKSETSNLVKALSSPKTRGRWGEIQLRRVVEMAGMIAYCDFFEQPSTETDEGRVLRPDMRIRLPNGKDIVIDAKTPLAAYLEAIETTDDIVRQAKLVDHARQVRNHISLLSKKSYWDQFESSPEFVVLFLPGEIFFSAALEQDPSLIETGVNQQVILATPTTLIALLKAVAFGWRQEKLKVNAQRISDLGKELYDRLCSMSGHFSDVGSKLSKAVESYNKAVGSLETRVLVSARKFQELEAAPMDDELKVIEPIENSPRHIQAVDLVSLPEKIPKPDLLPETLL